MLCPVELVINLYYSWTNIPTCRDHFEVLSIILWPKQPPFSSVHFVKITNSQVTYFLQWPRWANHVPCKGKVATTPNEKPQAKAVASSGRVLGSPPELLHNRLITKGTAPASRPGTGWEPVFSDEWEELWGGCLAKCISQRLSPLPC